MAGGRVPSGGSHRAGAGGRDPATPPTGGVLFVNWPQVNSGVGGRLYYISAAAPFIQFYNIDDVLAVRFKNPKLPRDSLGIFFPSSRTLAHSHTPTHPHTHRDTGDVTSAATHRITVSLICISFPSHCHLICMSCRRLIATPRCRSVSS